MGTVSLRKLVEQYGDRVQFLVIYIREAHPADGWALKGFRLLANSERHPSDITDPKTIEERRQVATRCESTLQYGISTLIDEIDNPVMNAYAALPARLYLVGLDGRVVYAGGPGPYGFSLAELKDAIDRLLEG